VKKLARIIYDGSHEVGEELARTLIEAAAKSVGSHYSEQRPREKCTGDRAQYYSRLLTALIQIELRSCNIHSCVVSLLKQKAMPAGHIGEPRKFLTNFLACLDAEMGESARHAS
jgi:hypothetical protein